MIEFLILGGTTLYLLLKIGTWLLAFPLSIVAINLSQKGELGHALVVWLWVVVLVFLHPLYWLTVGMFIVVLRKGEKK